MILNRFSKYQSKNYFVNRNQSKINYKSEHMGMKIVSYQVANTQLLMNYISLEKLEEYNSY